MSRFLQSRANTFELSRIRWRVWVMGLPGGVLWLIDQCRGVKWKDQRCDERMGAPDGH